MQQEQPFRGINVLLGKKINKMNPIKIKYPFLFFFLFAAFLSCKDEGEPIAESEYWGEATAEQNKAGWTALPTRLIPLYGNEDLYSFFIHKVSGTGLVSQELFFSHFPLTVSRIMLKPGSLPGEPVVPRGYFYTSDGDIVGNPYYLIEGDSIEDYLEITEIDTETGEVWGSFQGSYAMDTASLQWWPWPILPDTVVFRNGAFHAKVGER